MKNIAEIDLSKLGYRKDFDWNNRFDLKTEVNGNLISTVDLGIDHSFGIGEPLYYETMVFAKNGKDIIFDDLYCERYSTEKEAIEGHKKAIELVKNGKIKECD